MNAAFCFHLFLRRIRPAEAQRRDVVMKKGRVAQVLRKHYYGSVAPSDPVVKLIGSYAMDTAIRTSSDVDLIFRLPLSEYARLDRLSVENKQSYLLQEVRRVLLETFSTTDIKGDGPVVVVDFANLKVEVAPAFQRGSSYYVPSTRDGGFWKPELPDAEILQVAAADRRTGGRARELIKLIKAWRSHRSVLVKSLPLRLLALEFVLRWPGGNARRGRQDYDVMVRDFLGYMIESRGRGLVMPGTSEVVQLRDDWYGEAERALNLARGGVTFWQGTPGITPPYWSDIFGPDFPD